jgi:hypothetical protein
MDASRIIPPRVAVGRWWISWWRGFTGTAIDRDRQSPPISLGVGMKGARTCG